MIINKKFWRGKRVLITGNTGFKGTWLSICLNLMEAKILGYSLNIPTKPSLFLQTGMNKKIKTIFGDVRDKKKLSKTIKKFKPNLIFHLAAQSLVIESYDYPSETFTTNFIGTLNILEIVRHNKIKTNLIIATSDKCYENTNKKSGYKEIDKLGGSDPYSASKAATEILCKSYYKSFFYKKNNFKAPLVTVRAGNVVGGGDWSNYRLIPDIIRSLENDKNLKLRYPKAIRPWQHVLEPLNGYIKLGEKLYQDQIKYSGSWNFGPNLTKKNSVEYLVSRFRKNWELTKKIKVNYKKRRKFYKKEDLVLNLDYSKARKYLNWKPKWNTEKTIEKTINWYAKYFKNENLYEACLLDIKDYNNINLNK